MTIEERIKKAKELGAVFHLNVDDKIFFFRKPHYQTIGLYIAKLGTNPIEAKEFVYHNSIIKEVSDVEAFEDYDTKISLLMALNIDEFVAEKKITFTKL